MSFSSKLIGASKWLYGHTAKPLLSILPKVGPLTGLGFLSGITSNAHKWSENNATAFAISATATTVLSAIYFDHIMPKPSTQQLTAGDTPQLSRLQRITGLALRSLSPSIFISISQAFFGALLPNWEKDSTQENIIKTAGILGIMSVGVITATCLKAPNPFFNATKLMSSVGGASLYLRIGQGVLSDMSDKTYGYLALGSMLLTGSVSMALDIRGPASKAKQLFTKVMGTFGLLFAPGGLAMHHFVFNKSIEGDTKDFMVDAAFAVGVAATIPTLLSFTGSCIGRCSKTMKALFHQPKEVTVDVQKVFSSGSNETDTNLTCSSSSSSLSSISSITSTPVRMAKALPSDHARPGASAERDPLTDLDTIAISTV